MKKNSIRVVRTLNDHCTLSPEYADNFLSIDLLLTDVSSNSHDYAVRVYTSAYHYVGSDACIISPSSTIHKLHFDIYSSSFWDTGTYLFFVYRNSVPIWFSVIHHGIDWISSYRTELEDFSKYPRELFFAERLCLQPWWSSFEVFHFDRYFTRGFIDQCRLMSLTYQHSYLHVLPCYFVLGSTLSAQNFASEIWIPFITGNHTYQTGIIDIKDWADKRGKIHELFEEIKSNDVSLISFSYLLDDTDCYEIIECIFNEINKKTFDNTDVIFYGKREDFQSLKRYSGALDYLYGKDNSFVLPEWDNVEV